jgi:DNA-binding transcriptional ArsR family regulator
VLLALREPENTVALARALHLTESAVSQHLKRLTSAGLVESRRSGHRVYYRLSARGSKLISLFAPE